MIKAIVTSICCFASVLLMGQISVINPGFEDTPSDATVPQGWSACAFLTTPDILPGYWGVYKEPYEGDTYAGIITRENSTFESFGQRLSDPLEANQCYEFSIQLSHSDIYAGYGKPIQLNVWISDELCGESELIYTSPLIEHEEWKGYRVKFTPKRKAQYIMYSAFHRNGKFSYKGSILLDGMSSILRCNRV